MKVELKSVLRSEANHILNQLLLNLSLYKKRVRLGVNFIAKTVTDDKSQDFSTDKNLVSDQESLYSVHIACGTSV